MYNVFFHAKIIEGELKETVDEETNEKKVSVEETGRWTVLFKDQKMPFVPMNGQSIQMFDDGMEFIIGSSTYVVEDDNFFVFFEEELQTVDNYELTLEHLIEHEGWELLENDQIAKDKADPKSNIKLLERN